jgi:hypothetical protein
MLRSYSEVWPIYEQAGGRPGRWSGWPENKKFAFVLTHDVETAQGQAKCEQLSRVEEEMGFRSAFYFVPRRYEVSAKLRDRLVGKGFEVGVHGLEHDGKLYRSKREFMERAAVINEYLKQWNSAGFSSPCMLHNLEWIHDLNIEYDISTYDTDPFEPQAGGIGTVFPVCVANGCNHGYYVELPYTLAQDFTLFVLMKENRIDIWKNKVDWVVEKGGMVHLKTHPDYMNFGDTRVGMQEYPARLYTEILAYVKDRYEGLYWHVLPREVAGFWSTAGTNGPGTGEKAPAVLCSCCRPLIEQDSISFFPPQVQT